MSQFNPRIYSRKYYNRHLVQYRDWENAIGQYIVEKMHPSSILDLGCGVGSYLEGALKAGCKDILGIEISFDVAKEFFTKEIADYLKYGDITEKLEINRTFDCVLSIEAAEHIDPEGTGNFVDNLTRFSNGHIVLTAAPPGQVGTGHINLKQRQFWIDAIQLKGFEYEDKLTSDFAVSWAKLGAPWFLLRNLMVFRKC